MMQHLKSCICIFDKERGIPTENQKSCIREINRMPGEGLVLKPSRLCNLGLTQLNPFLARLYYQVRGNAETHRELSESKLFYLNEILECLIGSNWTSYCLKTLCLSSERFLQF